MFSNLAFEQQNFVPVS